MPTRLDLTQIGGDNASDEEVNNAISSHVCDCGHLSINNKNTLTLGSNADNLHFHSLMLYGKMGPSPSFVKVSPLS